jgi:hypothetical protein
MADCEASSDDWLMLLLLPPSSFRSAYVRQRVPEGIPIIIHEVFLS